MESTENRVLETLTTADQNTGRQITWNVNYVHENGPNVRREYGWTHTLGVSRPKGRRGYAVDVELIGDVVVRHNTPRVAF